MIDMNSKPPVTENMLEAFRLAKAIAEQKLQGFYHEGRHWIRDFRRAPGYQTVWEISTTDYTTGHMAMVEARERMILIEALSAVVPSPPAEEPKRAEGCTCQGCGISYHADLLVPDDVWARISPSAISANKGGGLLCPTCIMHRVTDLGLWTVGFAYPESMSGTSLATQKQPGKDVIWAMAQVALALKPLSDAVFNDNGELSITPIRLEFDHYTQAYFAQQLLTKSLEDLNPATPSVCPGADDPEERCPVHPSECTCWEVDNDHPSRQGCSCEDVEIGSYDNQIHLAAPPHMPKENGYCIDACLVLEVASLWKQGIKTTGCCCGHNKTVGYIGVTEEFIPRMKELGYVVRPNELYPEREDGFVPKSVCYPISGVSAMTDTNSKAQVTDAELKRAFQEWVPGNYRLAEALPEISFRAGYFAALAAQEKSESTS